MYSRSMTTTPRPLALAYIRVSTAEQAEHGVSLAAQREALLAEGERRGWRVEVVTDEGVSAKNMKRPGLQAALARLDAGEAQVLLAVRLDRVSRSVADFAGLMQRADRRGWAMRMLSPDLDTSDPAGRFTAHVLASAAEYERALISMRTREGMAKRRAEGVRFGPASKLDPRTEARIRSERAAGRSLRAIAGDLNAEGVPTATGKTWHASTVKQVAERAPR